MRRYDAGYRMLKAVVDTEIGVPLMVHAAHRPTVPDHYVTPMAINDTLIHEIDVLRWLLGDDYVSAQVVFPRRTARRRGTSGPADRAARDGEGVRIDVEVFVNCRYGYDIQCQVVGGGHRVAAGADGDRAAQGGEAAERHPDRLEGPLHRQLRRRAAGLHRRGGRGPPRGRRRDGYVAAISSDACVRAQENPGTIVPITLPARPALFD